MPCYIFLCFYYHRGLLPRASEMGVLTLLGKGIEQYLSRNIFRFQSSWIFIFGSIHYPLSFFSNFYSLVIMYISVLKAVVNPSSRGVAGYQVSGQIRRKKYKRMQKFINFWGIDFAGTGALPPPLPPPLPTSQCLRH